MFLFLRCCWASHGWEIEQFALLWCERDVFAGVGSEEQRFAGEESVGGAEEAEGPEDVAGVGREGLLPLMWDAINLLVRSESDAGYCSLYVRASNKMRNEKGDEHHPQTIQHSPHIARIKVGRILSANHLIHAWM